MNTNSEIMFSQSANESSFAWFSNDAMNFDDLMSKYWQH